MKTRRKHVLKGKHQQGEQGPTPVVTQFRHGYLTLGRLATIQSKHFEKHHQPRDPFNGRVREEHSGEAVVLRHAVHQRLLSMLSNRLNGL